jgi:hypothetical protein
MEFKVMLMPLEEVETLFGVVEMELLVVEMELLEIKII